MRDVEHLAVERGDAGVARRSEGGDYALGLGDRLRRRRERLVDHLDLVGVDRELAQEAVAPRGGAVAPEPFQIAEVGIDGVDRLDARGCGGEERKAPHQPVRLAPFGAFAGLKRAGLST